MTHKLLIRPKILQYWKFLEVSHLPQASSVLVVLVTLSALRWGVRRLIPRHAISMPQAKQAAEVHKDCECSSIECIDLNFWLAVSQVEENSPHAAASLG